MKGQGKHVWSLFEILVFVLILAVVLTVVAFAIYPKIVGSTAALASVHGLCTSNSDCVSGARCCLTDGGCKYGSWPFAGSVGKNECYKP